MDSRGQVKKDEIRTKSSDVIGANVFPLRCSDTVFLRPYRYFSIALKVFFFPSPTAIKFLPVTGYGLKFVKM